MKIKDFLRKNLVGILMVIPIISTTTMSGLFLYERSKSWDQIVAGMPPLDRMVLYYTYCRKLHFNERTKENVLNFAVNLVLHATRQYNAFRDVDQLFEKNAWRWLNGSSMNDALPSPSNFLPLFFFF